MCVCGGNFSCPPGGCRQEHRILHLTMCEGLGCAACAWGWLQPARAACMLTAGFLAALGTGRLLGSSSFPICVRLKQPLHCSLSVGRFTNWILDIIFKQWITGERKKCCAYGISCMHSIWVPFPRSGAFPWYGALVTFLIRVGGVEIWPLHSLLYFLFQSVKVDFHIFFFFVLITMQELKWSSAKNTLGWSGCNV